MLINFGPPVVVKSDVATILFALFHSGPAPATGQVLNVAPVGRSIL